MPRPTVVSSSPIPGWECKLEQVTDDQQDYVCSPSHDAIALVAWLAWVNAGGQPTTEEEAQRNWLRAEDWLIVNWENKTL